ncbi:MAG: aminodeoxychorismate synthase component I [Pseudohongiellaceae bacterium]|nr:aminodeoxychorismate synthase component I [Pseudohongiellaceae bacterium]
MNDFVIETLEYSSDSSELLRRLQSLPGLVMLDSGKQNRVDQRYDIISALPIIRLAQDGNKLLCIDQDGTNSIDGDIFSETSELLERFCPESYPDPIKDLPFLGGAIGCFAYEKLSEVGIYTWAIIVDHTKRKSLLFALPSCPPRALERIHMALVSAPRDMKPFALKNDFTPNFDAQSYRLAFDKVQAYIQAGDCYQVNLAQRFRAQYQGEPLEAYLRLRDSIDCPFAAYYSHLQGDVLCFSPERFLKVCDGNVVTQPIKGTRPRSKDKDEDKRMADALENSAKDKAENLMIVDLLRNDLGTLCETGSVQVDALFELKSFPNVHHLVSTISATLAPEHSPMQLLKNCFPGGSITGAPKKRAMEIIQELEPDGRAVYCGSIAYLSFDGKMDSNITIRTLFCHSGTVDCWGGGGLVADSNCEQEYQECFDKINNIIKAL